MALERPTIQFDISVIPVSRLIVGPIGKKFPAFCNNRRSAAAAAPTDALVGPCKNFSRCLSYRVAHARHRPEGTEFATLYDVLTSVNRPSQRGLSRLRRSRLRCFAPPSGAESLTVTSRYPAAGDRLASIRAVTIR